MPYVATLKMGASLSLFTATIVREEDMPEAEKQTARARVLAIAREVISEAAKQEIDRMSHQPQEQVLIDVRAPFAGEIVERSAVRGALVEVGKPLFTLADRSTMWAMLNIPEAQLARVQTGQMVVLDRGDQWQIGYVILKGSFAAVKAAGVGLHSGVKVEMTLRTGARNSVSPSGTCAA